MTFAGDRLAAGLRRHGEPMTLRRLTSIAPEAFASVQVYGKRYMRDGGAVGDELIGTAAQAVLRIKISNAEIAAAAWPGPPKKDDELVIAGRVHTLDGDADTRYDRGVPVAHFLVVKGGP
ncbi:MAG: hypothetical protein AB7P02_30420 [Alphaproteobacteria bacterium]